MNINNDNYRQFTYFILTLIGISALFVYIVVTFLNYFKINVPFYIELPSIPAVYGLLFSWFDKSLWKKPIFKKMGIIVADDLNGKWQGIVKSSYDKFKKDIKAELIIQQTATRIKICGSFNESKSVSVHENFSRSEIDNKMALFYFFRNEPKYDAAETMAIHEGSAKLIHDDENDILAGYYYSGRDRNNHGTIEVKRVKK
jgi:hypothetical protein